MILCCSNVRCFSLSYIGPGDDLVQLSCTPAAWSLQTKRSNGEVFEQCEEFFMSRWLGAVGYVRALQTESRTFGCCVLGDGRELPSQV